MLAVQFDAVQSEFDAFGFVGKWGTPNLMVSHHFHPFPL